jgi:hypothetical protein
MPTRWLVWSWPNLNDCLPQVKKLDPVEPKYYNEELRQRMASLLN